MAGNNNIKDGVSEYTDNSDHEDPYQTDEDDTTYEPNLLDISTDSSNSHVDGANDLSKEDSQNGEHITPKGARKRKVNQQKWKRSVAKAKRRRGEQYITVKKGNMQRKRELKIYKHTCRYNCDKIAEEERQSLFENYYNITSYDLQTAFLAACIKKTTPVRKKLTTTANKKISTCITVKNQRVCKEFFLKTFDITNRRFNIVCNKLSDEGFVEPDKRGRHEPKNKINPETRNFVINHIKRFPRYKSHYSRSQNTNTRYLSGDLNIRKMYKLYSEACKENGKTPVKEHYYRRIFCTEFNLKFHEPHSDTCHKCDTFNNIIKNTSDEIVVQENKTKLEHHQRKAENALRAKKKDIEYSKTNANTLVVCFDLQKALPTPLLTTNKVFYLRQLWTYNFCVHNLTTGKSSMYLWSENTASRGSQEIGSCLLKFIKELPLTVEHIIAYSDSCSGQNKNKNITKMFLYLVQCTAIKTIMHKFLEPGHTYMECDRDFGLIEKSKKKVPQVFIPDHWKLIIKNSSRNFEVFQMNKEDFYSFSYFQNIMKDPKKDEEGKPLKFKDIMWFTYKAEDFFTFSFKYTHNEELPPYQSEKLATFQRGRPKYSLSLLNENLYKQPIEIPWAKWENLSQLLPFIPPIYHSYYTDLPHKSSTKKGKKEKVNNKSAASDVVDEPTEDIDINDEVLFLESDYDE